MEKVDVSSLHAVRKFRNKFTKIELLTQVFNCQADIVHEAEYTLETPIEGDADYGRGSYLDTWQRTNSLYPFEITEDSRDSEPPTVQGSTSEFSLKLRSIEDPTEKCFYGHKNCELYHSNDSLFCSEHTRKVSSLTQDQVDHMVKSHLSHLVSSLRTMVKSLHQPPKEIVVRYGIENGDDIDFNGRAVLKRTDWSI